MHGYQNWFRTLYQNPGTCLFQGIIKTCKTFNGYSLGLVVVLVQLDCIDPILFCSDDAICVHLQWYVVAPCGTIANHMPWSISPPGSSVTRYPPIVFYPNIELQAYMYMYSLVFQSLVCLVILVKDRDGIDRPRFKVNVHILEIVATVSLTLSQKGYMGIIEMILHSCVQALTWTHLWLFIHDASTCTCIYRWLTRVSIVILEYSRFTSNVDQAFTRVFIYSILICELEYKYARKSYILNIIILPKFYFEIMK